MTRIPVSTQSTRATTGRRILHWLIGALLLGLAAPAARVARCVAAVPESELVAGGLTLPGMRRALILCGHPGDRAHRKPFAEVVEKTRQALIERYGFMAGDVHVQFGGPIADGEGPVLSGVRGQATREEIETEAAELRKALKPQDALWVIVMGHSHYDGKHSQFNIPGPDI